MRWPGRRSKTAESPNAMKLALKIDVGTLRGTREGAPNLVEILRRHDAGATFVFSVGPDLTGRAALRVLGQGGAADYGFRSLLYGTLLPPPDIGRRAGEVMRRVRDAGFETGLHAWAPVRWQARATGAAAAPCDRGGRGTGARVESASPSAHAMAGPQVEDSGILQTR